MDIFGRDPLHSFPSGKWGSKAKQNRPRRPPRPPALVRVPLTAFERLFISSTTTMTTTSTTTTTTTASHVQDHNTGALQPITRFCHPQDANTQDGPPISDFLNTTMWDILRYLQSVPSNRREELFWDMCQRMLAYFNKHCLPSETLWVNNFLSWRPQTELVLYSSVNSYRLDFKEIGKLGRGGYGLVVEAHKHLDDIVYAVKIITMDRMDKASISACLLEVKTLARLDHPRLVRYFTAWIEQEIVYPLHRQRTSAIVREYNSDTSEDSTSEASSENSASSHSPSVDDSVVFQDTKTEAYPLSPSTQSRQTQGNKHAALQENDRPNNSLVPRKPQLVEPQLKKKLFIQMEQCGMSLRKWIDDRNDSASPVVEEKCLRILHQVAEALCYVHCKGYMHRDIKPANILFTHDGLNVKLGDFGLACLLTHPSHPRAGASSHAGRKSQNYTRNVGTPLYTAPEVELGDYGEKSDMYSLGIILLELFMPFKTYSERSSVISNLKETGKLDRNLTRHWPVIADWIKKLANNDPAERPTAKELLDSPLFRHPLPLPSPTATTGETIAGGFSRQEFTGETIAGGLLRQEFTGETIAGGFPRQEFTGDPIAGGFSRREFALSEFTSFNNTIEINEVKTEKIINNHTICIEERLSKDEQIAVLKEENDALKREIAALKRDLGGKHHRIGAQNAENGGVI